MTLARRLDRKTQFTPLALGLGLLVIGFRVGELWFGAHGRLRRLGAILVAFGAPSR
jgi:hypothetical protein